MSSIFAAQRENFFNLTTLELFLVEIRDFFPVSFFFQVRWTNLRIMNSIGKG